MKDFKNIGMALRFLRTQRFQKQREVAKSAGITPAMLSAYETGKHRPSLETTERVLDALGCDVVDLTAALQHANAEEEKRRIAAAKAKAAAEAEAAAEAAAEKGETPQATTAPESTGEIAVEAGAADGAEASATSDPAASTPQPTEAKAAPAAEANLPVTPTEASQRMRLIIQRRADAMKLNKDEEAVIASLIPGILALLRHMKKP